MFQTHTSGQSFTLLVNPSQHFCSITSGRCFPCHVCNFWSILHTSNQSWSMKRSRSNWKEFSVSILVNPSHFWSIMFQTHTSGQFFTLLVNPSHVWSITSGRCFPCHACNFWSILHISNQSVTLLPVTSGQSLTLPEGQFCTGSQNQTLHELKYL